MEACKTWNIHDTASFPIWDIPFGTYIGPKKGEWPVTGLGDGRHEMSILEETAYPFLELGRKVRGLVARTRSERITATE